MIGDRDESTMWTNKAPKKSVGTDATVGALGGALAGGALRGTYGAAGGALAGGVNSAMAARAHNRAVERGEKPTPNKPAKRNTAERLATTGGVLGGLGIAAAPHIYGAYQNASRVGTTGPTGGLGFDTVNDMFGLQRNSMADEYFRNLAANRAPNTEKPGSTSVRVNNKTLRNLRDMQGDLTGKMRKACEAIDDLIESAEREEGADEEEVDKVAPSRPPRPQNPAGTANFYEMEPQDLQRMRELGGPSAVGAHPNHIFADKKTLDYLEGVNQYFNTKALSTLRDVVGKDFPTPPSELGATTDKADASWEENSVWAANRAGMSLDQWKKHQWRLAQQKKEGQRSLGDY